jgi:hypothetical protein
MASRTIRDFETDLDLDSIADVWARENHFAPAEGSAGGTSRYVNAELWNRATTLQGWLARLLESRMKTLRIVTLRRDGKHVHFEAWIQLAPGYRRLMLFTLPREMGLEGGHWKQRMERWQTRRWVNPLLEALGQPPIK